MKMIIPDQTAVLKHYGVEKQTVIWMEELAELSKAASKCLREDTGEHRADLAEEIADVLICIKQMRQAYKIPQSLVEGIICEKWERQNKRMTEETHEKTDDK